MVDYETSVVPHEDLQSALAKVKLKLANKSCFDLLRHISLGLGALLFGGMLTRTLIPPVAGYFLRHTKLYGLDLGKKGKPKTPESLGIVVGTCYLVTFILCFLLVPYYLHLHHCTRSSSLSDEVVCISNEHNGNRNFCHKYSNLAALTSIFAMLLLGFIDDCYDLKWRYKLMLPFAASIPLLSVYYYSYHDMTTIVVPAVLRTHLGFDTHLDLGVFYYIYMLMYVVFCTNAINIYAGINGLEAGQSVIIAMSVIIYNIIEFSTRLDCDEVHIFSMELLLPLISCSLALLYFNWYPAKVFVGDSYCYFAGMTLAVVGILGHFSEEILLFAIPQIFNFLLSLPQIVKIVPCPRHRLPSFDPSTGLLNPSSFEFRYDELNSLGKLITIIFSRLKLIKLERLPISNRRTTRSRQALASEADHRSTNFTLINLWLCWFGPIHERNLCKHLLYLQACISAFTLIIITTLRLNF